MIALRAGGLLAAHNESGVLGAADVHVATRLGALTGETDERVLLALALVVRGTRLGSVVLDLADVPTTVTPDETATDGTATDGRAAPPPDWPEPDGWVAACAASPLVAAGPGGSPVRIVGSRLWLDRYWRQEAQVADDLVARSSERPTDLIDERLDADLDALFPDADEADQRHAVAVAARSRASVVAGGPGTGKTTTIARLIAVLLRQQPQLRVALAAPTGKAAARLQESVQSATGRLDDADRTRLAAMTASTLHRLLGWRPGASGRFRHDRDNRLPFDVVIVDECSMVSLTLMARLVEALAPTTRLVLVGDPDQLASVEAGAVLGDLVEDEAGPLRASVATLRTVHRFDAGGPIAQLAEHVRAGRANDALAMLRDAPVGLELHLVADDEPLTGDALRAVQQQVRHERAVLTAARAGDARAALDALDRHRLLCAHNEGPRGVRHWGTMIERWLAADDPLLVPRLDGRYAGQPLLVTANDYENELFNGDTGVVVQRGDELMAAFRRGGEPVEISLVRLSEVRPLHAMSVYRAQGSQADEVTVLLPFADSPLATRQTFYTAITRASRLVRVVGSEDAVRACVERRAARATGLRDRLRGELE